MQQIEIQMLCLSDAQAVIAIEVAQVGQPDREAFDRQDIRKGRFRHGCNGAEQGQ
jgi:hypothetical protein